MHNVGEALPVFVRDSKKRFRAGKVCTVGGGASQDFNRALRLLLPIEHAPAVNRRIVVRSTNFTAELHIWKRALPWLQNLRAKRQLSEAVCYVRVFPEQQRQFRVGVRLCFLPKKRHERNDSEQPIQKLCHE